ncbi:hypothetical protein [Pseudophaeobacter arcticus]|jgi:hypothetical protein|uniref:hypothetical protein n=1 Tax=Pseudophaeobacter arcticus TaxID=385492 RepID=UPI0012B5DC7C|nr:hypothetical protein [Pseudophaeobacter arcticus]
MFDMRFRPLLALVALVALGYFGSYWWETSARRPVTADAQPVRFLSEEEFLVLTDHDVRVWRADDLRPGPVVFSLPQDRQDTDRLVASSCFSHDRWILDYTVTTGSGISSSRDVIHVHLNGKEVLEWEWIPRSLIGTTLNGIDCEIVPREGYGEYTLENPRQNQPDIPAVLRLDLFSRHQAQNVLTGADYGTFVFEYGANGQRFHNRLEAPGKRLWQRNGVPEVRREAGGKAYWLSGAFRDAGRPADWPTTVWRLDMEAHDLQAIDLPKGPWVADYKERFNCFSCGCGCYRKISLYPTKSQLVAHIHGQGFPSDVQGIYVLPFHDAEPEWRILKQVSFRGWLAMSPSGCQLIFADPKMQRLELC